MHENKCLNKTSTITLTRDVYLKFLKWSFFRAYIPSLFNTLISNENFEKNGTCMDTYHFNVSVKLQRLCLHFVSIFTICQITLSKFKWWKHGGMDEVLTFLSISDYRLLRKLACLTLFKAMSNILRQWFQWLLLYNLLPNFCSRRTIMQFGQHIFVFLKYCTIIWFFKNIFSHVKCISNIHLDFLN